MDESIPFCEDLCLIAVTVLGKVAFPKMGVDIFNPTAFAPGPRFEGSFLRYRSLKFIFTVVWIL